MKYSAGQRGADAIVIGGGPAGCTTAILLRKYNPSARIVLFEREKFPRHHVGESTLPDANAVLHKLGVIDALNRQGFPLKCGLTYKWRDDRPIFTDLFATGIHPELQNRLYPRGIPDHSWQVDRGRYDAILLERAREVGVEVHEETTVVGTAKPTQTPTLERANACGQGLHFRAGGDNPLRTPIAKDPVSCTAGAEPLGYDSSKTTSPHGRQYEASTTVYSTPPAASLRPLGSKMLPVRAPIAAIPPVPGE